MRTEKHHLSERRAGGFVVFHLQVMVDLRGLNKQLLAVPKCLASQAGSSVWFYWWASSRCSAGPLVKKPGRAAGSPWVLAFLDKHSCFPLHPSAPSPAWESASETGPAGVASNEWLGHKEQDLGWEGGGSPQGLICPHSSQLTRVSPVWLPLPSCLPCPSWRAPRQNLAHPLGLKGSGRLLALCVGHSAGPGLLFVDMTSALPKDLFCVASPRNSGP